MAYAKDTKKFEAKAKNSSSENRLSQGQGQECLRPRLKIKNTGGKCSTKKARSSKFSSGDLKTKKKQSLQPHFSADHQKKLKTKIKAKDQGHRCKCSPRKNGLQENFSSGLQNFNVSKNSAVLEANF